MRHEDTPNNLTKQNTRKWEAKFGFPLFLCFVLLNQRVQLSNFDNFMFKNLRNHGHNSLIFYHLRYFLELLGR